MQAESFAVENLRHLYNQIARQHNVLQEKLPLWSVTIFKRLCFIPSITSLFE